MDALGQRTPVQPRASADLAGHHQFTVDDAPLRQLRAHRVDHLREVARQVLASTGAQHDVGAVAEDDGTESVPLRLVRPHGLVGRLFRHSGCGLGQHRLQGWRDRKIHGSIVAPDRRLRAALRRRCRRSVRLGSFEHRDDGRRVARQIQHRAVRLGRRVQFQVALAVSGPVTVTTTRTSPNPGRTSSSNPKKPRTSRSPSARALMSSTRIPRRSAQKR